MTAPARVRVASAPGVTMPRFHGAYKARKKIDTDLEIGDMALIDGSTKVKIINKGNCSAVVEDERHERRNISFDRLIKVKKEPTSSANEEGK